MLIADLIRELRKYPADMVVKVVANDGNGYYHETPVLKVLPSYTVSNRNDDKYMYHEIEVQTLEISS